MSQPIWVAISRIAADQGVDSLNAIILKAEAAVLFGFSL